MRCILLATLASLGLAAGGQTVTGQAQAASNNSPLSPIVCQTPQLDALSKDVVKRGMSKYLCVQTDILVNLNSTGAALATAVHSYAPFPEANGSTVDPTGITCRKRIYAAQLLCAFNSFWTTQEADARRLDFLSQGQNSVPPPAYTTMENGFTVLASPAR